MKIDYFYSAQIERVIKHIIRIFSNFQVSNGYDDAGEQLLKRVPCRYGDISRQAGTVIAKNSENLIASAPIMVVNITKLKLSRENVRGPISETVLSGFNKKDASGNYTNKLDGYYEIERLNPVPWDLEFTIDIWSTTQQQKMELFEQIAVLFAPTVALQLSTNPLDWTSANVIEMTDYELSSRNYPQGTDYTLDISKFSFKTMIWLSLPNKVNRAQLIEQIVVNTSTPSIDDMVLPGLSNWDYLPYNVFTPGNHSIYVSSTQNKNQLQLSLRTKNGDSTVNGLALSWEILLEYYSYDISGCHIRLLELIENSSTEIVGDLVLTQDPNIALLNIRTFTLPNTTIDGVDYVFSTSLYDIISLATSDLRLLYIGETFNYENSLIDYGSIINYNSTTKAVTTELPVDGSIVESKNSGLRYKYSSNAWNSVINSTYSPGLWRIGFNRD